MSFLNLFGGGDDSSSHATNTQRNESSNNANSGISGAANSGNNNSITITQTDHGATALGALVANNALKANQNVVGGALDFADAQNNRAQYTMLQSLFGALGFGREALDAERAAQSESNDLALEALHVGTAASANALDRYTDEVNQLVQQTSTNNDERILKLAEYGLIAAVILATAPMFFGKKR